MRLPTDGRPIRSQHFAPGTSFDVMRKAASSDADQIVLELEDGVAPARKNEARANILRALEGEIDLGTKSVLVRINHLDTQWGRADLAAVERSNRLDGVILPKVETAKYVQDVLAAAPGKILWFTYETTRGKRAMPQILETLRTAGQIGMIRGMIFGNNDYSAQFPGIHADDRGNLVLQAARASMLELAHEFGLIALDGPSRSLLPDEESVGRYRADCEQGRSDGFDGKQTINLAQIAIVNEIFSPARAEIEQAEMIKRAYEAAIAAQKGAVNVGGSMTETMHYAAALATLKLRDAIAEMEARQAAHRGRNSD